MAEAFGATAGWTRPPTGSLPMKPGPPTRPDLGDGGACRVRGLLEADRHDTATALYAFDEASPLAERLPQPLEAARFMAAHGAVLASSAGGQPPSAR